MQPWDRCARLGCGHARHGVRRGEGHFQDGMGACKEPRCTCPAFAEEPRWKALQQLALDARARRRRAGRRLRGAPGAGGEGPAAEERTGAPDHAHDKGSDARGWRGTDAWRGAGTDEAQAVPSAAERSPRPPWRPAA